MIARRLASLCLLLILAMATPSRAAEGVDDVVALLEFVIDVDEETAGKCLATLRERVQSGEISGERLAAIRQQLDEKLRSVLTATPRSSLFLDAMLLAASWNDPHAQQVASELLASKDVPVEQRLQAIDALAAAKHASLLKLASTMLVDRATDIRIAERFLGGLGRYDGPEVAKLVLDLYPRLAPNLQPQAIELLTQRAVWSRELLAAIERKSLPAEALSVNHLRKLLSSRDAELVELVRARFGAVRTDRNPQREQVIAEMRTTLTTATGNPVRGRETFQRVCGQCHKIHGIGQDVGPEITRNGRNSFDQLLSNVFDPSLVIGPAYQARTVVTVDGRVLTGLLTEDNEQRVVLKVQGGKLETIPREDVDEMVVSQLSLMPEGLETQLPRQELIDLIAFLTLDLPPEDPSTTPISGTPPQLTSAASKPE